MENQYNYYNSDGMNGNGQGKHHFMMTMVVRKHQVPHGKKTTKRKFPKQWQ